MCNHKVELAIPHVFTMVKCTYLVAEIMNQGNLMTFGLLISIHSNGKKYKSSQRYLRAVPDILATSLANTWSYLAASKNLQMSSMICMYLISRKSNGKFFTNSLSNLVN